MREGWTNTRLGDCLQLLNGFAFKSNYFTDNSDDLVLIKGSNLGKGQVLWRESKYWKKEDELQYLKYILKDNYVILAMYRPWVGGGIKFAIIKKSDPKSLLVQRIACLRANKKMEQLFLKYVIASNYFALYIKSVQGGVGVPHISPGQIKNYKFNLPPLATQRKIATILSAYDDLIENNLKRIRLLEEKAQLTYEEWFVRMKFPGHETTPINEETGLPVGWAEKTLQDVCKINARSLKKEFNETIHYIDIASVSPGRIDQTTTYDYDEAPGRAKRIVKHGDIIWSCVRPNRKSYSVIWNPIRNLIASTGFCVISPKALPASYLLQVVTTDEFVGYLTNRAGGAAYPAVKAIDFKEAPVVIPPKSLMIEYDNQFKNCLEVSWNLQNQNQLLQEARDLLLPRLMTWVIDPDKLAG